MHILKFHSIPEERQKEILRFYFTDTKKYRKFKGMKEAGLNITKSEWAKFAGYLYSAEFKRLKKERNKTFNRPKKGRLGTGIISIDSTARTKPKFKVKKPKSSKQLIKSIKTQELKDMPYSQYLLTDHWDKVRKLVRARDKFCVLCESTYKLQTHHRRYVHRGDFHKEVLDCHLLCEKHHKLIHQKLTKPL